MNDLNLHTLALIGILVVLVWALIHGWGVVGF